MSTYDAYCDFFSDFRERNLSTDNRDDFSSAIRLIISDTDGRETRSRSAIRAWMMSTSSSRKSKMHSQYSSKAGWCSPGFGMLSAYPRWLRGVSSLERCRARLTNRTQPAPRKFSNSSAKRLWFEIATVTNYLTADCFSHAH